MYTSKLVFVCFETNDSIRANARLVDNARGQVEPVTGFQRQLLSQLGQTERDASLHYADDLVIGMRVRGINIEWSV